MQNLQRDRGVAGETHWLLDEELAPRRPMHVARPLPVLLRHDAVFEPARERVTEAQTPPSEAGRFALSLFAAVAIYLVLRGADVGGALQSSLPRDSDGSVVVTAMLTAEPEARLEGVETAALRTLLGSVGAPEAGRPGTKRSTPAETQAPNAPATEDPLLPLQPPAPAPDPLMLLPEMPQSGKVIGDLERATGLEPATLSLEG
jgi:hypothetical protein